MGTVWPCARIRATVRIYYDAVASHTTRIAVLGAQFQAKRSRAEIRGCERLFCAYRADTARASMNTETVCHTGQRFGGSTGRTGPTYIVEASAAGQPTVHGLFESDTGTWQYVVADPTTCTAVIIDPVLNYDRPTRAVTTPAADALLSLIQERGYSIEMILETHAHADHVTAASQIQSVLAQQQAHKPPIGIGARIGQVQRLFGKKYGVPAEEYSIVFDKLFADDETFKVGSLSVTTMHLPGHTPDHLGYRIGDNLFCGDTLFHPDIGTARCDFPGGSARHLFASGRRVLSLPDHIRLWPGHDYPSTDRRAPATGATVAEHRKNNRHLKDGVTEDDFVALRETRDATLSAPKLLDESLQMNIRAGRLPTPTASGQRMLHLPLKLEGIMHYKV